MLSDVSIKKYMESGDIVIRPWGDSMMGAARVTLHLGDRFLIPDGQTVVDVKKGNVPEYTEMRTDKGFALKPNMFVIAETREEIGISERVGMMIDGRSTLARLGLSVVENSFIVDTGQRPKKMTLELKNSGPNTIILYPGMRLCRACFFKIDPPATRRYDDRGRYKQDDTGRPVLKEEIEE